jgi:hypothetical protein
MGSWTIQIFDYRPIIDNLAYPRGVWYPPAGRSLLLFRNPDRSPEPSAADTLDRSRADTPVVEPHKGKDEACEPDYGRFS